MLRKRVKEAWAFQQSKFLPCVRFFFLSFFSGVKVLHCTYLYLYLPPFLISPFPQPLPVLQSSPVTLAFSPNVNPNRLSTEGYCSSSQKRRQIFRYWGAADFDLCVAMPIFWKWFGDDSGALWWFFYIFAWRSRLIDGYSSTAPWGFPWPMHGCFVISLGTDWPTYPSTHLPSTTFFYIK